MAAPLCYRRPDLRHLSDARRTAAALASSTRGSALTRGVHLRAGVTWRVPAARMGRGSRRARATFAGEVPSWRRPLRLTPRTPSSSRRVLMPEYRGMPRPPPGRRGPRRPSFHGAKSCRPLPPASLNGTRTSPPMSSPPSRSPARSVRRNRQDRQTGHALRRRGPLGTTRSAFARVVDGEFGWDINDPGPGLLPRPRRLACCLRRRGASLRLRTWGPFACSATTPVRCRPRAQLLLGREARPTLPTRPAPVLQPFWVIGDQGRLDLNQLGRRQRTWPSGQSSGPLASRRPPVLGTGTRSRRETPRPCRPPPPLSRCISGNRIRCLSSRCRRGHPGAARRRTAIALA